MKKSTAIVITVVVLLIVGYTGFVLISAHYPTFFPSFFNGKVNIQRQANTFEERALIYKAESLKCPEYAKANSTNSQNAKFDNSLLT